MICIMCGKTTTKGIRFLTFGLRIFYEDKLLKSPGLCNNCFNQMKKLQVKI